ncbi:MAG: tetratricopeptide repeat protein [Lentisphaeraceae bacterium]|nr:tetratricopeptide repeat protein [Lentisphaeraceae bacterium]
MKKIIIIILVVLTIVGSVDPYCNYIIDKGFNEKNPGRCLSGALIKQRMFKYRSAISVYKKIIKRFPKFSELDRVYYYMAHCYEKDDNATKAIAIYAEFIQKFPKSKYLEIGKKKMSNLKANSETDDI